MASDGLAHQVRARTDLGADPRLACKCSPWRVFPFPHRYVPGPIWGRILANDADWIVKPSETRTVTLLLVRLKPPMVASRMNQVAAYTAATALFQRALYKCRGTFKHMLQSEEGCTVVGCLGLPPFEHSEVGCALGAMQAATEVRSELRPLDDLIASDEP